MSTGSVYDVVVVGAGLVGLATAYQVLSRRPDLWVAVLDKETTVGRHQSSHNSGVLHSGVYYTPGSLKARLCREGKAAIEDFAAQHGIPVEWCGKVIVAVDESERGRLVALYERGQSNGVPDLSLIGPRELRDVEPHAAGVAALRVGDTAITDFAAICEAYADEVVARGGDLLLGVAAHQVAETSQGVTVLTDDRHIRARAVVTCAGLYADRFGRPGAGPGIVPFRGQYYTLTPEAAPLVKALIYPVPDPSLPFLGVHFTRRINGEVWAGPNAVPALAREGYRRHTVRPGEAAEMVASPGFRRLARHYWRTGAAEVWRDASRSAMLSGLRRYLPDLEATDLVRGPSGVRAQAVTTDGTLVDDFAIIRSARAIHVRNAPSPAATASLAIGDTLADDVLQLIA
jgi:L-2-hydroxyglutarate oxidase LhgO